MQCASSTASSRTPSRGRRSRKRAASKRSGATKSSRTRPCSAASSRASASARSSVEFTNVAGIPARSRWSTWSFMREMSGLTTSVRPDRTAAGTW